MAPTISQKALGATNTSTQQTTNTINTSEVQMTRQHQTEDGSAISDYIGVTDISSASPTRVFDTLLQQDCDIDKLPPTGSKCFGLSIKKAIRTSPFLYQGFRVPILIYRCIEYLDCTGSLAKDGIFRYGAPKYMIDKLESEFDQFGDIDLKHLPQECVLTLSQQEMYDKWKSDKQEEPQQEQQEQQQQTIPLQNQQQRDDTTQTSGYEDSTEPNLGGVSPVFPVQMSKNGSFSSFSSDSKSSFPSSRPRRLSRTSISRERGLSASTIKTVDSFTSGTTDYAASLIRRGSNYEDIKEEPEGQELIVSAHAVATLMKRYLRKLDTHLINKTTAERIQAILNLNNGAVTDDLLKKQNIREILGNLDNYKLSILICILRYLDKVLQYSNTNKISINGLAVLFNANLTDDFKGENLNVFTELLTNRNFYFICDETMDYYRNTLRERKLSNQLNDMGLDDEAYFSDKEVETDRPPTTDSLMLNTRDTMTGGKFSSSSGSTMNVNFKKWMDKFRKNTKQ